MSTDAPMVTGTDFVIVPVTDYEASAKFYGETLGLPFAKRWGDMPAGEFETGNLTLALMQPDAFGREFAVGAGAVALRVDDVEARQAELEDRGVKFVMDAFDSGVCHQALFLDPDGNTLILHNRYAPVGERPSVDSVPDAR